ACRSRGMRAGGAVVSRRKAKPTQSPARYLVSANGGVIASNVEGLDAVRAKLLDWCGTGRHLGIPRTELVVRSQDGVGMPIVCSLTVRGDADWQVTDAAIRAALPESGGAPCP